jgi:hypothetical protein
VEEDDEDDDDCEDETTDDPDVDAADDFASNAQTTLYRTPARDSLPPELARLVRPPSCCRAPPLTRAPARAHARAS